MFIGHFAVGFATKRLVPEASLGWHAAAPLFLDVLFPVFVALGIESLSVEPGYTAVMPLNLYDIPWSHSLVMSVVWSVAFAGVYFALRKSARTAAILGAGVFSHFVLDLLTHRPEMQLWPGAPHVLGLHLWSSVPGTLAVEVPLFLFGVFLYARSTRPRAGRGKVSFAIYVALLLITYVATIFGPPPPTSGMALAGVFLLAPLIPWAWSFDRYRQPTTS